MKRNILYSKSVFLTILIFEAIISHAGEQSRLSGWEIDDAYQKHYNVDKFESFKGRVLKVKEVVPMEGMSAAVALEVKKNDHIIEVQICPTWFVRPEEIGIKKGDRVKIRGVPAIINGKNVFMASKIKKGDYFQLKVRLTRNGKPFWTMAPEALFEDQKKGQEISEDW